MYPPNTSRRGPSRLTCPILSGVDWISHNGKLIRTRGGNCKTRGIVYAAQCVRCNINNTYVGKTTTNLATRVNGHRSNFYKILRNTSPLDPEGIDDSTILGAHLLLDHNFSNPIDFNASYKFYILTLTDPVNLRKYEQFFINKLNCKYPLGLNRIDSIQSRQ